LKLSECQNLYERINQKPILEIDDIGMHLDNKRMLSFFYDKCFKIAGQIFITSPDKSKNIFFNLSKAKIFEIKNGQII